MNRRAPPVPDCDQVTDERLAWRTEKFLELGFTDTEAAALAATTADWHDFEALIKGGGCSPRLAVRILAPER